MAVYIIDEIMGRGKSSAAIRFVNESPNDHPFLFIVPYLTETDRIRSECAGKTFKTPHKEGGKLNNIKPLLRDKENIVATHALFQLFDDEVIELVQDGRYTLIMDEVSDVASEISITPQDMSIVLERYAHVGAGKKLYWDDDTYEGRLDIYRNIMGAGNAYAYNDNFWVNFLPPESFLAFEDIYIMTYLFEHQIHRCYFDLFGIRYERLYIAGSSPDTYRFSETQGVALRWDYRSLIRIEENEKLNAIGDHYYDLSKNWYRKETYQPTMKRLKNNTLNFYRNYAKTPASRNMWTTFGQDELTNIDWFKILAGGGFARCGIPCNAKGTNEYRGRTSLAYLINRFPKTHLSNFLTAKGIDLNRDMYALSEMIQWIWRSAIRDGKEIYLYIPSRRMRELLIGWLDRIAEGGEADEL